MVSAGIVAESNETLRRALLLDLAEGPKKAAEVAQRFGLGPARSEAVFESLAEEGSVVRFGDWLVNGDEVERLVARFGEISWGTILPVLAVVLTLVLGVLACAQLLASVA